MKDRKTEGMTQIVAQYAGTCVACEARIEKGEQCLFGTYRPWAGVMVPKAVKHLTCRGKADPKPRTPDAERLARVVCPKCGNAAGSKKEDERIEIVETLDVYRIVVQRVRGPEIIGEQYPVEGDDGDGRNPRFRCQKVNAGVWCGHTWALPEWVQKELL